MRRLDLNLLYVLREMLREPNTTKAGEKLSITQPAVSAALGRLRWAFQDELFVRSGRGLAPTKRAEGLLEPVERIIQQVEDLIEEVRFEPQNLQRHFTLATTDIIRQQVAGPILGQIHPAAPHTKVSFSPLTADTRDRLRTGHIDLMIAPNLEGFTEMDNVTFQPIYTDRLAIAVWAKSKAFGAQLSEAAFLEATHLEFNPGIVGGWKSTTQTFFDDLNIRPNVIAEFSTQMSLACALRNSDMISVMPKRLIDAIAPQAELRALELPFASPEIEFGLLWNQVFDTDPEHEWFRDIVGKAVHDELSVMNAT